MVSFSSALTVGNRRTSMCNVRVAGGGHPPRLPQNVACGFADLPHYALQALVYSTA
jgi:hypothetical protein